MRNASNNRTLFTYSKEIFITKGLSRSHRNGDDYFFEIWRIGPGVLIGYSPATPSPFEKAGPPMGHREGCSARGLEGAYGRTDASGPLLVGHDCVVKFFLMINHQLSCIKDFFQFGNYIMGNIY